VTFGEHNGANLVLVSQFIIHKEEAIMFRFPAVLVN
jgi:hypothetical protein